MGAVLPKAVMTGLIWLDPGNYIVEAEPVIGRSEPVAPRHARIRSGHDG